MLVFKRILLVFVLLILMTGSITPMNASQNDAGTGSDAPDDQSSAVSINFDTRYTGMIGENHTNTNGETDNYDYYKISVSNTGNLSLFFNVTNPSISSLTSVSILDESGLIIGTESLFQDDTPFYLDVPIIFTQTVYIEINTYSDDVQYSFKPTFQQGSYEQKDAGTNGDASFSSPKSISLDTTYHGLIGNGEVDANGLLDSEDWFSIDLTQEGYLDCSASISTPDTSSLTLRVYTTSTDVIVSDVDTLYGNPSVSAPIYGSDTFYVNLQSFAWNASYDFSCSFTAQTLPSQDDANTGGDAAEEYNSAPEINANSTFSGTAGEGILEQVDHARDEYDLYKMETLGYGNTSISLEFLESPDSYPSVYLDLHNNSDLFSTDYLSLSASSTSLIEQDSVILEDGSEYYLEIFTLSQNVSYQIEINHTSLPDPNADHQPPDLSTPPDTSYKVGSTGNQISWDVGDANPDTYNITRNGSVYKSTTSWNNGTITLDTDGLDIGTYNFTIFIYDTEGNMATDSVFVTVYRGDITPPDLNSPDDINYQDGQTGNQIEWMAGDKNPGVYNVTKNGSLFSSATSWNNGSITVNVDGLNVGTFNFTIYVFDTSNNVSSDSVSVSVTPDTISPDLNKPGDITYEEGTSDNTIEWTAGDVNPDTYNVTKNGSIYTESTSWTNGTISVNINGFSVGNYSIKINVYDSSGNVSSDTVIVSVTPSKNTSSSSTSSDTNNKENTDNTETPQGTLLGGSYVMIISLVSIALLRWKNRPNLKQ